MNTMESLYEVVVTLTPLETFNFPRCFTLDPSRTSIEIGRASKTASKGLAAAVENAWFDSPIMSRSHAELEFVTSEHVLYLRDLHSTHGTFLGHKQILPNVDYSVKSGDIITFGQKVTSGALTYPAKDFRIEFYLRQWSNPTSITSPETRSKTSQPGFHFPYSDEEDDDSESISSDPSLEIIDSPPPPRHRQGERPVAPSHDFISLDPEGPILRGRNNANQRNIEVQTSATSQREQAHLGADKAHPIDLEKSHLDTEKEPTDDSDLEAPDVLPSTAEGLRGIALSYMNKRNAEEPSRTVADSDHVRFTPPGAELGHSEDDFAIMSDNYSLATSEDDFSDDYSDEEITEDAPAPTFWRAAEDIAQSNEEPASERIFPKPNEVAPNTLQSQGRNHVLVENSQLRIYHTVQPEPRGFLPHSATAPLDSSQLYVIPETQCGPTPRAPSPSDAALVKPPQAWRPINPFTSAYGSLLYHTESVQCQSFPRIANHDCSSTGLGGVAQSFAEEPAYHLAPAPHNTPFLYHPEDLMSPQPTRYEDGPFTTGNFRDAGINSSKTSPADLVNTRAQSDSNKSSLPDITDPLQPMGFLSGTTTDRMHTSEATEVEAYLHSLQCAERGASVSGQEPRSLDRRAQRLSRVPISDIVNQTSTHDESPKRSLKRKAEALEETEMTSVSLEDPKPSDLTQDAETLDKSEDSPFHDAQPREYVLTHDSLRDMSQQSQVSTKETSAAVQQDDRPAKRVKTSRGKARPFKAFVSGILVGCVSLVAMGAAFIAAIPESVREEAHHELF